MTPPSPGRTPGSCTISGCGSSSRARTWTRRLATSCAGRLATGLAAPVDLRALDWVTRADHVRVPTLILHSEDDEYVPVGPSMALAERNPELVRFVRFTQAGHTREQNVDPVKWDRTVRGFLRAVLAAPRPGRTD